MTTLLTHLDQPVRIFANTHVDWRLMPLRWDVPLDLYSLGMLPVYSVGTEEEARELAVLACPRDYKHRFVAPELAERLTLPNLFRFAERLDRAHDTLRETGRCRCLSAAQINERENAADLEYAMEAFRLPVT